MDNGVDRVLRSLIGGRGWQWASGLVALVLALDAAGCGPWYGDVKLSFDNRTDALLCVDQVVDEVSGCDPQYAREVKPKATAKWTFECSSDGDKDRARRAPVKVVIGTEPGGQAIYQRMAPCGVWQDSRRIIVIEEKDGSFVVSDGLPDTAPEAQ